MSVKSFFHSVGEEFEKLFGKAPAVEQKIQSAVAYAGPFLISLLGFVDPAAVPEVTAIVNVVKSDLATISTVAKGASVAPGTPAAQAIITAATSINTNMASILALASVKNSSKASKVEAVTSLITGEMQAVLGGIASTPAATTAS